MENVNAAEIQARASQDAVPRPLVITAETIAYVVLAVLAIILRIAELDTIPLSNTEAHQALAALHVVRSEAFGEVPSAASPLLLLMQSISFTLLGGHEFAARILTALAGAGVAFTPLLFKEMLGRSRTFLMCALLVFSPILLLASRFANPFVWTLLLGALCAWAALRYRNTANGTYGVLAIVLLVATLLLTDFGSVPLVVIVLLSLWLSQTFFKPEANDLPEQSDSISTNLAVWPWLRGLGFAAVAVFLVGTIFVLHPSGLSNVGTLLANTVQAFTSPQDSQPALNVLLNSVFYETFYWILGITAVLFLWQQNGLSAIDRFFAVWLFLGILASVFFVGGTGAHALWLTIPLVGLIGRLVREMMREDRRLVWNFPMWARWAVAVATIGLLAILSIALQTLGRSLMRQDSTLGVQVVSQLDQVGLLLTLVALAFIVVGFFLAASIWDTPTAARGLGLGALIFGALTSLGGGWSAAVPLADNANEPYHMQVTTGDAPLLRQTLLDIAKRDSRGFPMMSVAVSAPEDGIVAWMLRDFTQVKPITSGADVDGEDVVLLPQLSVDEQTGLEATYAGQDFILTRSWSIGELRWTHLLLWWLQHETPRTGTATDTEVLWLRQDIYAGIDSGE